MKDAIAKLDKLKRRRKVTKKKDKARLVITIEGNGVKAEPEVE